MFHTTQLFGSDNLLRPVRSQQSKAVKIGRGRHCCLVASSASDDRQTNNDEKESMLVCATWSCWTSGIKLSNEICFYSFVWIGSFVSPNDLSIRKFIFIWFYLWQMHRIDHSSVTVVRRITLSKNDAGRYIEPSSGLWCGSFLNNGIHFASAPLFGRMIQRRMCI